MSERTSCNERCDTQEKGWALNVCNAPYAQARATIGSVADPFYVGQALEMTVGC
jgi:hypothetical protein